MSDDADVLDRVERRLVNHGVYVDAIEAEEDRIRLEYESVAPGDGVQPREAGRVINTFREFEAWEPRSIEATVYDADGDRRGSWRMDVEWLEALEAGDLSEVEFSERVIASIRE